MVRLGNPTLEDMPDHGLESQVALGIGILVNHRCADPSCHQVFYVLVHVVADEAGEYLEAGRRQSFTCPDRSGRA